MELTGMVGQGFDLLVWLVTSINSLLGYVSNFVAQNIKIGDVNALIIVQLAFSLILSWSIVKEKGFKLFIVLVIIFIILYTVG